jgi:large subunit ribosomal protein L31e
MAEEKIKQEGSAPETAKPEKNLKVEKKESKIELEREYVIPLRRKISTVPRYRRAKKAIRVIREFLAKHMKVENRDISKIKIDKYLNQEIWFRGIKKPAAKIKVKAVKKDGIVYAELADIPEKVKFDMEKDKKRLIVDQKKLKQIVKKEAGEKEMKEQRAEDQDKKEESEKEKAVVESGFKEQRAEAKEMRHEEKVSHKKVTAPVRKALKK